MKILSIALITFLVIQNVQAQSWRHIVPSIEELNGVNLKVGELFLDLEKNLKMATSSSSSVTISGFKPESYDVPTVYFQEAFLQGAKRKIVVLEKGKVKIGLNVYANTANVYCRHDINEGLPGGYDDVDPFASGTLAYIYIVPDSNGYNCILSTSSTGLNNTDNVHESLLVGIASYDPFYPVMVTYPIINGEVPGNTIGFGSSGIKKITTCQEISVTNYPDNVEMGSFAIAHLSNGINGIQLYDGPGCVTKVLDFDLHWGSDFFGEFPSAYIKDKKIYVTATITGTPNTTAQFLSFSAQKLKFKKKYFNQGTL